MIVLDTNVISALMRKRRKSPFLSDWTPQSFGTVWITAITVRKFALAADHAEWRRQDAALLRLLASGSKHH